MKRTIPDYAVFGKPHRGAAMVEFAIVLPLLLFITFGVLELGVAFIEDITLNKSVREASRYVASQWDIPGCYTDAAEELVKINMNDIFAGSSYNDFALTDSVTIDQVCVDEDPSSSPGNITATNPVSATCTGNNTLCTGFTNNHKYVRTTAVYQHKQLLPNLQIGPWQINYAPTLRAESMMRILN